MPLHVSILPHLSCPKVWRQERWRNPRLSEEKPTHTGLDTGVGQLETIMTRSVTSRIDDLASNSCGPTDQTASCTCDQIRCLLRIIGGQVSARFLIDIHIPASNHVGEETKRRSEEVDFIVESNNQLLDICRSSHIFVGKKIKSHQSSVQS
jgi:hypothetical protein